MTLVRTDDRDTPLAVAYAAGAVERTRLDPLFPRELIELQDGPASVWIAGEMPAGPRVAIVGSRAADAYGQAFARRLAADLALEGVPVVSGGAMGIDVAAHRGAIETGGTTVAVLGTGIGYPYPIGHEALFERIARGTGALVTEHPEGTPPRPFHFVERNRILVALAAVVVVVQAAHRRSGAMVSARAAIALRRRLLAVPGTAGSVLARGPHALLRRGEADWCEGVADVLAALREPIVAAEDAPDDGRETEGEPPGIDLASHPGAAQVWQVLGAAAQTVEDIVVASGLGPGVARGALMWLESRGAVRYEYGGRYARAR